MTPATTHDTRHACSAHEATHQRSARRAETETTHGNGGLRVKPDVSELVLSAQCELALARVDGPLDFRSAFEHAVAARRWARIAGLASLSGARIPFGFAHSPILAEGWHAGQAARACSVRVSSLPH